MPGKFEEGCVFFAHIVQNADSADSLPGQPDNLAPRTAELPLQGLDLLDRRVKVLLKKTVENIHQECRGSTVAESFTTLHHKDIIEERRQNRSDPQAKTSSAEGARIPERS